ncbi:MAG: hypothetical protein J1D77_00945 [Muribaculaceae bacterium]|nr:hypothetical protein [Muribaculaceae bacterium]
MRIPPINISGLVRFLREEGLVTLRKEMTSNATKVGNGLKDITGMEKVEKAWYNTMSILELQVVPVLRKGCEPAALRVPAASLVKSGGNLVLAVSQVLSLFPGPVGIVCCVINAIVAFSQGKILLGFFELLCCIPGIKIVGKTMGKVVAKYLARGGGKVIVEVTMKESKAFAYTFGMHLTNTLKESESFLKVIKADGKGFIMWDYLSKNYLKKAATRNPNIFSQNVKKDFTETVAKSSQNGNKVEFNILLNYKLKQLGGK